MKISKKIVLALIMGVFLLVTNVVKVSAAINITNKNKETTYCSINTYAIDGASNYFTMFGNHTEHWNRKDPRGFLMAIGTNFSSPSMYFSRANGNYEITTGDKLINQADSSLVTRIRTEDRIGDFTNPNDNGRYYEKNYTKYKLRPTEGQDGRIYVGVSDEFGAGDSRWPQEQQVSISTWNNQGSNKNYRIKRGEIEGFSREYDPRGYIMSISQKSGYVNNYYVKSGDAVCIIHASLVYINGYKVLPIGGSW